MFVQVDGTLVIVDALANSIGEYYCQVNEFGEIRNVSHYLLEVLQPTISNTIGECYKST